MQTAGAVLALTALTSLPALAAVTQVEGAAGGGIVPWALLSGGRPTASFTWVDSGDYTLSSVALQGSIADRVELSYARQTFDTGAVGLGEIDVDVFGAKVKVLGMSDTAPQLALGVQYKRTDADDATLAAWGADDSGTDVYVAATKVLDLGPRKALLNGTLRATKANQIGILGFGATGNDDYDARLELSAGLFVNDNTVIGGEYRSKPDNINGINEDAWADLFIAHFPNPGLALTAAYADLGDVAAEANPGRAGEDQRGLYLQLQVNF